MLLTRNFIRHLEEHPVLAELRADKAFYGWKMLVDSWITLRTTKLCMWSKCIPYKSTDRKSKAHCVIFFQQAMGQWGELLVAQQAQRSMSVFRWREKVLTLRTEWPLLDLQYEVCSSMSLVIGLQLSLLSTDALLVCTLLDLSYFSLGWTDSFDLLNIHPTE